MNILDEWWKRLLISFALGGIISKVLGQLTIRKVEISALLIAVIFYIVLTRMYNRSQKGTENESEK
ncbi:hypothetical protein GS03_01457 [Flavobacterium sangjuense]|uniref:Uncharacterized protein n=1 Tax=Flavobacterium sangjuense TaxID=2518177 RepID=A0A4P7PSP8_9FLAO|nr:hypothetical protein GS03_01457 [Flavobacterium sangjuense]